MATVRLSEALTSQIMDAIQGKYHSRFEDIDTELREAAVKLSWELLWEEPEREHVRAIRGKLNETRTLHLAIKMPDGSRMLHDVPFDPPGPLPNKLATNAWSRMEVDWDNPKLKPFLEVAVPLLTKRKELERECESFKNEVRDTLGNFRTVNQVLKSWPAIENLLPLETLQKAREKAQRQKAGDVAVDQHALNTKLLKINIMS